jgi:hypothetical protein
MGVFRSIQKPTYADQLVGQVEESRAQKGGGDLEALFRRADTWVVGDPISSNGH